MPGANVSTPQNAMATVIGDGSSVDITVSHNLNSLDVDCIKYSQYGDLPSIEIPMERLNANQVRFKFVEAPATASIRVVIYKPGASVSSVQVQGGTVEYGAVEVTRDKLGLGTVSVLNSGISAGNVPVLNENAVLPNSVMPPISLSEYKGAVATKALLTSLSTAEISDWAYVSSDSTPSNRGSWILNGVYSTLSNWIQISGPMAVGVEFAGYTIGVDSLGNTVPIKKNYLGTITGDGSTTDFTINTSITNSMRPNLTDQNGFEYITECVRVSTTSWKVVFDTAPFGGQIYTVRVTE